MSIHSRFATVTLPRVTVGIRVRLHGKDGEDIGFAHAPEPVALGDALALADGSTWRVVSLINISQPGSPLGDIEQSARAIDVLCIVQPIEF